MGPVFLQNNESLLSGVFMKNFGLWVEIPEHLKNLFDGFWLYNKNTWSCT